MNHDVPDMSTLEAIGWTALGVVGLAGSALCSGMELGIYSLNRVRLDLRIAARPPRPSATIIKDEIQHPGRLVATLLIGNNLFHYLIASASTAILAGAALSDAGAVAANFAIILPLVLVVGEALPKELFRVEADRLTYVFARPLRLMRAVFSLIGILPLVSVVARLAERLAGLKPDEHLGDARQRMALLLKEGASSGALSESQTSLVDRALALRDETVEDEMVPWDQVRRLSSDTDRARATRFAASQPSSRLPVVDRAGRVVGILRQIDLYTTPSDVPLEQLLTPPVRFDPETRVLDAVQTLLTSPSRLGVVERDGRAIGIVTAKDLVEPLTGELPDW